MVADNDENILSAFHDYLRRKNYSMTGVTNVETGLKKIRQQNFNLIITDVRLNSEFGTNFISKIKAARSNLSIIAITSYPDKINEKELRTYGADYLFVKPLELNKLDEAIENCLKSKSTKIIENKQ